MNYFQEKYIDTIRSIESIYKIKLTLIEKVELKYLLRDAIAYRRSSELELVDLFASIYGIYFDAKTSEEHLQLKEYLRRKRSNSFHPPLD